MTNSDKELDELLYDYAYEVYITNDLPDEKQDEEQARLLKIYEQRLNALIEKKVREAVNEATQPYHYTMPIKSVRTRNTAFKLYAVKFFNGNIKKRRERLLATLQDNQAKEL